MGNKYISDFTNLKIKIKTLMDGKEVIGFDIFDTLLRRKVEPEYIKDLVTVYFTDLLKEELKIYDWQLVRQKRRDLEIILGQQSEAKGLDHELLYEDLLQIWITEFISDQDKVDLFIKKIKKYEIELEKTALCLTPGIKEILEMLKNNNKKMIFISDMYFSIETIREFLNHFGLEKYFDAGFCSSQFMKKKMTGKLFDLVIEKENISVQNMLFVGDNFYSDVEMTTSRGIDAIHINDLQEKKRKSGLQLAEWAQKKEPFWTGYLMQNVVTNIPSNIKKGKSDDYDLGLLVSPILILFVKDIIEKVKDNKIEKIYFLAREGKVFFDIYNELVKNNSMGIDLPEAKYLYVSRKSTFLPSINELTWEELNRFLIQYNSQSLNSFLNNLNVPAFEYYEYASAVGITDFDEEIADLQNNEGFKKFIEYEPVIKMFKEHQQQAKDLFEGYLSENDMFKHENVAFVDIGWKGTIQDNIVKAFVNNTSFPKVHGFYLGLLEGSTKTFENSVKSGFFAEDKNGNYIENVIFKNGSLFEMCTTPNHGTTIGYVKKNNSVEPILKAYEVEKENYKKYFVDVFEAIQDYLQDFLSIEPLIIEKTQYLKLYYIDQIRRYILYPTKKEAKNFVKYSHVESFGVNKVTTYEFKGSILKDVFRWPIYKAPTRILHTVKTQIWPEGVLKRSKVPFINFVYDYISTKRL